MQLKPEETVLRGFWLDLGSAMTPDAVWERIGILAGESLQLLATGENNTDKLYRDPADGRLWELSRVAPQMKDGGPPCLTCIEVDEAEKKYGKGIGG
jgi:Immunity protein 27